MYSVTTGQRVELSYTCYNFIINKIRKGGFKTAGELNDI